MSAIKIDTKFVLHLPVLEILNNLCMGARNRVGKGIPYRPAMRHRLAESIPGLLKTLKIPSLLKQNPFLTCRFEYGYEHT